jgi:peptidoglycan/LPS O-acetylase OafA/YrhL
LAVFVILHHVKVNFFTQYRFESASLAVEAFYVISGFFIALSCFRSSSPNETLEEKNDAFAAMQVRRFKKIWPEFIFAAVIWLGIKKFVYSKNGLPEFIFAPTLLTDFNFGRAVPGGWYVTELFFFGMFLSAILIYRRRQGLLVWVPAIALACLYSMLHYDKSMIRFSSGKYFFDGAELRAVFGLCVGALAYAACRFVEKNPPRINPKKAGVLLGLGEAIATVWLSVMMSSKSYPGYYTFGVFYATGFLLCLFHFGKEKLLKFFSSPRLAWLSRLTFMTYLTHLMLIEPGKFLFKDAIASSGALAFVLFPAASVALAWLLSKVQKRLFSLVELWLKR